MQKISVQAFSYNKDTKVLSEEASSLTGRLDLSALLRYETFEVVGHRETKRYCLYDVQREKAFNEVGDIQAWLFRPVDNFGRGVQGPKLMIWND